MRARLGKEPLVCDAALLARHERLMRWVVGQQRLGPLSYRDTLHEGRIRLWQALRHYDPTRGTTFSTYAVPAIAHAVWNAVAREQAVLLLLSSVADLDPVAPLHALAATGGWICAAMSNNSGQMSDQ